MIFNRFETVIFQQKFVRFQHCLITSNVANWSMQSPITIGHYVNPSPTMYKIEVTLLILHADDDPIVHGRQMNWNSLLQNKHIIAMHTKRGGHVAHFDQIFPIGDCYSDRVIVGFVSAVLESHSYTRFLVNVVRNSLLLKPDLQQSVSSGNLARIVSRSDLQTLAQRCYRKSTGN